MADLIAVETQYGSIRLHDALDDEADLVEIPQSALAQREVIALLQQLGFNIDTQATRLA